MQPHQESRRRDRDDTAATTEAGCTSALVFSNDKLLLRIFSFLVAPISAHEDSRVYAICKNILPLRRVNKFFLEFIDGKKNGEYWAPLRILAARPAHAALVKYLIPLMTQRRPPMNVFARIKGYTPDLTSKPFCCFNPPSFIFAAVDAQNEQLVEQLLECGEPCGEPATRFALLRFAVDMLAAGEREVSVDMSGTKKNPHRAFFAAMLARRIPDAHAPTEREYRNPHPRRIHQPAGQQPAAQPPVQYLRSSALEHALFRHVDECTLGERAVHDRWFQHVQTYHRNEHNGFALMPRIPLEDIRALIDGPSREVVSAVNPQGLTMLDRLVQHRVQLQLELRPKNRDEDLSLRVMALLASVQRTKVGAKDPMETALLSGDTLLVHVLMDGVGGRGWDMRAQDVNYLQSVCSRSQAHEDLNHAQTLELLRLLVKAKAQWNPAVAQPRLHFGPLHRAVAVGDLDLVKALINDCGCGGINGCVNTLVRFWNKTLHVFCNEYTPLRIAAMICSMDLCKYLCEHGGAQVDTTALKYANEMTTDAARELASYLKKRRAQQ